MKKKFSTILLVLLITLSTFVPFSLIAAYGLPDVAYWRFDEGSGTVASDSSGNGNTGTLKNGPQWVNGISGTALSFDGSDDYVSIPDSSSLDISGDQISIEFWMKPTVDLPYLLGTHMKIFDKGDAYLGEIRLETETDINYGKIAFALPFSVPYKEVTSTRNSWTSGTWYHLAFTYDGSNMRLYVNGALENSVAKTGNVHSSSFPLSIGSYCLGTYAFFKGILDEIAIYNYARTAEEIWIDYKGGVPATVDIDPDKLNLKSNGQWITAYITLSEGYSVESIDITTVELRCDDFVSPADWGDIQDGVFMVKFDRAALMEYIGEVDLFDGDKFYTILLTVSGELLSGTPFEGSDTIDVIGH